MRSLWLQKVKCSFSFICFRWPGSRHRSVLTLRGLWMQSCAVWITILVRTYFGAHSEVRSCNMCIVERGIYVTVPVSLLCDLFTRNYSYRWPHNWRVTWISKGISCPTRNAGGVIGGVNEEQRWENMHLLVPLSPRNMDRKYKVTQAVPLLNMSFSHYIEGVKGV